MATATPDSRTHAKQNQDRPVKPILNNLQALFDEAQQRQLESDYFEEIAVELRDLHARMRVHHAVGHLGCEAMAEPSPELMDEVQRLADEHPVILGLLDRIIRAVDSMADRTLEDKEVFFLRGQEVIALVRRHEAEEDRIFYLSIWRDTGGEC